MLLALAVLSLLQAGPPEPGGPPPAPRGVEAGAPAPAAVRGRYAFRTFGGDLLAQSDLIAEVRVESVIRAGPAVVVTRMTVSEAHLVRSAREAPEEIVTLAPPDDYVAGQEYLVFLERFEDGGRFRSLRRLSKGERDFDAKRRVLHRYAELERIEDDQQRALAIRDALLELLKDDELFVRWNALTELESFVENHKLLFGPAHRASIVATLRKQPSPTFRRRLMAVLEELGVRLEGGTDG